MVWYEPNAEGGVDFMDVQAVVALVAGTVLVLSIPALALSTDIVDRFRRVRRR